ncbi:probable salivary secreted peptide [Teleopsis dalmanni]|uniref:probable salivary secreted peptide n=1 Tax=Teleopsis dalmanni TaxID=139649 RepID=UPI0018CFCFFE|nr:probable salivary secreted peptide [Teleopsis dalmanni]
MKCAFVLFLVSCALVAQTYAGNNYEWGQKGNNDWLIAEDTVQKAFIVGISVSKKYVFKQKDSNNAYTITAIVITDKNSKNGTTAELLSGGPGSKGATIQFKSGKGAGIKDVVKIYARY